MNRSPLQIILISAITSAVVSVVVCQLFLRQTSTARRGRWSKAGTSRLVAVPPLQGLTLLKARNQILQSGLRLNLSRQKHAAAKEGTILLQYPDAGSSLRKGGEVQVIVSLGPRSTPGSKKSSPTGKPSPGVGVVGKQVKVPWVRRMRLRRALARIRRAGLRVGRLSYRVDNDVSPNWVLSQSPVWGTNAPRGSRVNLVVNKDEDD